MAGLYLGVIAIIATMLWVIVPPAVVKPNDAVGYALLVYFCLMFLKVLLDDAVHFNDRERNGDNWPHGIALCIVWNVLILNAIRVAAGDHPRSIMYGIFAMLVGTAWLFQNYSHKAAAAALEEKQRHLGWAFINIIYLAVLSFLNIYLAVLPQIWTTLILAALVVIVLFDAIHFGTFRRVAASFR